MNRFKTYRELTWSVGGPKRPLMALGFFKIWSLVFGLIPLFLYAFLVNHVLVARNSELLWLIIIGYLAVFLLASFGIASSKKFSNQLMLKYDVRIKNKLLRQYTALDNDQFAQYKVGDIKSRIEDDTAIAGKFFIDHILEFIYAIVYAIVLAGLLLYLDWRIALLSFVFVPLTFMVFKILGKKRKQVGKIMWQVKMQYETFLHTTFQNWKDIKANNLEEAQLAELNKHLKKFRRATFLSQLYIHLAIMYSFCQKNFITQLFLYFVGGLLIINGYAQIGTMLVMINFYGQFNEYINSIGESILNYKNDSVNLEKVIEILRLDIAKKPCLEIEGGDIEVEDVRFAYKDNNAFFLKGVSFSVGKGKHLAIVGESGGGKSTVAKLLTGQLAPQSGNIRIGGVNIYGVGNESLAKKISIVMQESVLFNMTIRENLLLAKPGATDGELMECCRKASIIDFIETLPGGFDTVIGEKGVKLSGGQKQRLSIARAFLLDRDIIIFDESTSALDSEKEKDIVAELKNLSSGKTMISIAHRLPTVLSCDTVMVLKNGVIAAMDTHAHLRGRHEIYDELFQNQYRMNEVCMFLSDLLERQKDNHKVAITYGEDRMTYHEWYARAQQLSEIIDSYIPLSSRNVALFLPNSPDYAVAYFAAVFSDRIIVPVGTVSKGAEILSTLAYCEVDLILTNERYEDDLRDCLSRYHHKVFVMYIEDGAIEIINNHKPVAAKLPLDLKKGTEDDVAVLLHTSGTTSSPKRVMLTHKNLLSNVEANVESLHLTEKDVVLIAMPMYFGYCHTAQFLTHLYLGASMVILQGMFMPKLFWQTVQSESITNFTGVPSMLLMLLEYRFAQHYDISSLRYICFGGGKMPEEELAQLIARFTTVGFVQTYGQTEASPRCTALLPEDALRKIGSVGRPIPDVSVRIVDDAGNELAANEMGEIVLRGDNIMKGYYKNEELTQESMINGWLRSGDYGFIDEEGYLFLTGRKRNIIISGGINLYPEEIEEVIMMHPNIQDVCVVPMKHKYLGEVPVAKVVLRAGRDISDLRDFCRSQLTDYKVPVRFDVVTQLTKTYNGKTKRYTDFV